MGKGRITSKSSYMAGLNNPEDNFDAVGFEDKGIFGGTEGLSNIDLSQYQGNETVLSSQYGLEPLADKRAADQSYLDFASAFVGNIATTAVGEVIKGVGYGLGALGLAGGGKSGLDGALDNTFNNGIQAAQDYAKENWFAYHKPSDFDNKSLGEQLMSSGFWATEGADGIGFLASFLAPGQLLKMANVGGGIASGVTAAGKAAKAGMQGSKIGRTILKGQGKLGIAYDAERLAANANSLTAVAVNTAMEAAAEGTNAYDTIFQKAIADGMSKEEATAKAAEGAAATFKGNTAILLASNMLLEKYLMGGFNRVKGARGAGRIKADNIIDPSTLKKIGKLGKAKSALTNTGAAFLSEGIYEEGLQSSLSKAIEESGDKGLSGNMINAVGKYIDAVDDLIGGGASKESKELGRAVILGGILGGGMGSVAGVREASASNRFTHGEEADYTPNKFMKLLGRQERKAQKGALAVLHNAYTDSVKNYKDMYDADGKFKPDTLEALQSGLLTDAIVHEFSDILESTGGNAKEAKKLLKKKMDTMEESSDNNKLVETLFDNVQNSYNGQEALSKMKHNMDVKYMTNFLQQEGGLELLKTHIDTMVDANAQRYLENTGVEMSREMRDSMKSDLISKADTLSEIYKDVKRGHNNYNIQVDHQASIENINEKEDRDKKFEEFWRASFGAKLNSAFGIDYVEKRIAEIEAEQPTPALDGEGNPLPLTPKQARQKAINDLNIKAHKKNLDTYNKILTEHTENAQEAWEAYYKDATDLTTAEEKESRKRKEDFVSGKQKFWEQAKEAGYDIGEDLEGNEHLAINEKLYFTSNDKSFVMERMPNGKYEVLNIDSGKRVTLSKQKKTFEKILKKYPNFNIQSVDERNAIEQQKEVLRLEQELLKSKNAQLQAIHEFESIRKRQLEKRQKILARDNKTIMKELRAEIRQLKKDVKESRMNKRYFKQRLNGQDGLRARLAKAKNMLAAVKDEIAEAEKSIPILQEHIRHAQGWYQLVLQAKDIKNVKTLNIQLEQRKSDLEEALNSPPIKLESVPEIQEFIQTTLGTIRELVQTARTLEEFIEYVDTLLDEDSILKAWVKAASEDAGFRAKYSYLDETGIGKEMMTKPELLEAFFKDNPASRTRFFKDLRNFLRRKGIKMKQMKRELAMDAASPTSKSYKPTLTGEALMREYLMMTAQKLKDTEIAIDEFTNRLEIAKIERQLQIYDTAQAELAKNYKKAMAGLSVSKVENEAVSYEPEANNKHATSEQGFLPVNMFNSTGLSLAFDSNKQDIRVDGKPVGALTPYQTTWFNTVDKIVQNNDYVVQLRTANYEATDELNSSFAANNQGKRSKDDVYVVLIDKKTESPVKADLNGNIVEDGGLPVFTSMRRTDSMFPVGKKGKQAERGTYKDVLKQVVPTKELQDTDVTVGFMDKKLSTVYNADQLKQIEDELFVKDTASKTFGDIERNVLNRARMMYGSFINKIVNEGPFYAPIDGISGGHATTILDKDGNPPRNNPLVAFAEEMKKPYEIVISNAKGIARFSTGRKRNFIPGTVILRLHNGKMIPLQSATLGREEVKLVLDLLAKANRDEGTSVFVSEDNSNLGDGYYDVDGIKYGANTKGGKSLLPVYPQKGSKVNLLSMILNYGVKRDKKTKAPLRDDYSIWVDKKEPYVHFGRSGIININDVQDPTKNADLVEFLNNKYVNINKKLLKSSVSARKGGKSLVHNQPVGVKGNTISFKKTNSYLEHLMTSGKLYTSASTRAELEKHNLPQFAQRNIAFSKLTKENPKKVVATVTKVNTPVPTPAKATKSKGTPTVSGSLGTDGKLTNKAVDNMNNFVKNYKGSVAFDQNIIESLMRTLKITNDTLTNPIDVSKVTDKNQKRIVDAMIAAGLNINGEVAQVNEIMKSGISYNAIGVPTFNADKVKYMSKATETVSEVVEETVPDIAREVPPPSPPIQPEGIPGNASYEDLMSALETPVEQPKPSILDAFEEEMEDSGDLFGTKPLPKGNYGSADRKVSPSKTLRELEQQGRIIKNCK